jgi:hypothetical protein
VASNVLLYHPPSAQCEGEHLTGYPRMHHDASMVAKEAMLKGVTEEQYVADTLSYKYSDGKPVYTLGTEGKEEFAPVAAKVEKAQEEVHKPAAEAPPKKG